MVAPGGCRGPVVRFTRRRRSGTARTYGHLCPGTVAGTGTRSSTGHTCRHPLSWCRGVVGGSCENRTTAGFNEGIPGIGYLRLPGIG